MVQEVGRQADSVRATMTGEVFALEHEQQGIGWENETGFPQFHAPLRTIASETSCLIDLSPFARRGPNRRGIRVDYLVGLKENVILGHLIPAGTGFRTHQEAEVRLNAPRLSFESNEEYAGMASAESLETAETPG